MTDQPRVSVIVPAYNAAQTVERALSSILTQSLTDLEVIVVNDGSTDQTLVCLDRIAASDSRVRVLSQPNGGVSAARNSALPLCRGKYIRFVDADDTLPPGSLEAMVSAAEQEQVDLVIGGYSEYLDRLSRSRNLMALDGTRSFEDIAPVLCANANTYFFGVLWNKLFSASLIRRGGLAFDPALWWGEDFAFVMDSLKHVDRIAFLNRDVYDYRRSPRSATFRQVLDCVVHPAANIRIKIDLYSHLKGLYVSRSLYPSFRRRLWHYLFRVGY